MSQNYGSYGARRFSSQLPEVARRLVAGLKAERVILFGSCAWGNPDPDSDIDLLVIEPDSELFPTQPAMRAYRKPGISNQKQEPGNQKPGCHSRLPLGQTLTSTRFGYPEDLLLFLLKFLFRNYPLIP